MIFSEIYADCRGLSRCGPVNAKSTMLFVSFLVLKFFIFFDPARNKAHLLKLAKHMSMVVW